MGIWEIVVGAVVLLLAVIMIIVIMLQEGHDANLGAITGGADSFMGKGKARTADAIFAKVTKYCAIAFFVIVVLLNALSYFGLTGKADNGTANETSQAVVESSVESVAESSANESSVAESSAAESSANESSVVESSAAESSAVESSAVESSVAESSVAVASSTASAE